MKSTATTKRSLLITLELTTLYILIQLYIWHWQYTYPRLTWLILSLLFASHLMHRDTHKTIGLRIDNWLPALRQATMATIPFVLVLFAVGFLTGRIWILPMRRDSSISSLRYILWGTFQQYGLQGYFHNRLLQLLSSPVISSSVNALIFMTFHIPNPVLMVFTLAGGFVLSMLFARHRNILVLGPFHGIVGLLISNTFPPDWLHNMRVGPGYYR